MDNLVLIRVAAALHLPFRRALLRELREEATGRFRLIFEIETRTDSIVVSIRPDLPWIGRPAGRFEGVRRPPGPFAAACAKALRGTVLEAVEKLGADRIVALRFAGGRTLVAELATHRANLVLVDPSGTVAASARRPRAAGARIEDGSSYRPPELPAGKVSPFELPSADLDRLLAEEMRDSGDSAIVVLRRRLFGVGSEAAALVIAEAARRGSTPGEVLADRLAALAAGEVDPVIDAATDDPMEEASRGILEPLSLRLLPWDDGDLPASRHRIRRSDAASTAGLYHDAIERLHSVRARGLGLRRILDAELSRISNAERRVGEDLASFADPDRHRVWGEALLAGLTVARRSGEHAIVPDPYDPEGREIAVPAAASMSLTAVAEDHFRRQRRSRRAIEAARRRVEALRGRRERLQAVAAGFEGSLSGSDADRLTVAMRGMGIPVGLEQATKAARVAARAARPRLEGVRIYTSSEGVEILVGRTGRDNDRLTFRLAGPDDFWLHARGTPGAHVIIRNPKRDARPSQRTLEEAASLAAWWSDARGSDWTEVQWTRRKNVRRLRGAAPGTVTVKRHESVRVRPAVPAGSEDSGA